MEKYRMFSGRTGPLSFLPRTDLACESRPADGEGAVFKEWMKDGFRVSRTEILKSGEKMYGKPAGCYITADIGRIWLESYERFCAAADLLSGLLQSFYRFGPETRTLVIGLGNAGMMPDALGPLTVRRTMVTYHLPGAAPEYFAASGLARVAAVAPGVMGQTGIEIFDMVCGIVKKLRPDIVIAVDALASRSLERLTTTVQLSNTGIVPGSGVGNARHGLHAGDLGIPVLALGVPTVVDAVSLAWDVIEKAGKQGQPVLTQASGGQDALRRAFLPQEMNCMVTPRDIDLVMQELSRLCGYAINRAVHGGVSYEEMARCTL